MGYEAYCDILFHLICAYELTYPFSSQWVIRDSEKMVSIDIEQFPRRPTVAMLQELVLTNGDS